MVPIQQAGVAGPEHGVGAEYPRATVTSKQPKKILITHAWGERLGGSENRLWTFLRHVDRSRIRPMVIFFEPGAFEREVAALGIPTAVLAAGRFRQARLTVQTVWAIASLLRREKPDLVLNWQAKVQIYGGAAALLAGMGERVAWWQPAFPSGPIGRLATLLPARAVGCSSRFIAAAQARRWPGRRTFVIHPGIDPPAIRPERELAALRSQLAIPAGRVLLGIVGRLQAWKGQDRFLRVLLDLHRRGHDVHGLVVGGNAYNRSPGYEPFLHRLARDLGLKDRVTFTGQVPVAGPYLQLMDISVNASLAEPFGIVLLEAMALGVPVVAFNGGGPPEIIEPEKTGLLVPAGDERLLTDALERLLTDAAFRQRLGEAGRKHFLARFTAQRMTEELEQALEELCRREANRVLKSA